MCLELKSQTPKNISGNRQLIQSIKSDIPNIPSAKYAHYLQGNTQLKLIENNVDPLSIISSFTPTTTMSVVTEPSDDNILSKDTTSHVTSSSTPTKTAPTKKKRIRKRKKLPPGLTATKRERVFIKHDYHDYANDSPKDVTPPENNGISTSSSGRRSRRFRSNSKKQSSSHNHLDDAPLASASFPIKLHAILDHLSSDSKTLGIMTWQPHGRAFVVRDKLRFAKEIMPKYFNQTRFTSFQRQLSLYGFLRLSRGRDQGGYYHEMFLRGREWLCQNILRVKSKGVGMKAAGDPEGEPDFWSMPFVNDTDNTEKSDAQTAEPAIREATTTNEIMSDSPRNCNDPSSTSNDAPPANHGVGYPQYHNRSRQSQGDNERKQLLPLIKESMGSFDPSFGPEPLYNKQDPLRGNVSSLSSFDDMCKDDNNENNQSIDDLIVETLLPSNNDEFSGDAASADIIPTIMSSNIVSMPTFDNNHGYHSDTTATVESFVNECCNGGNLSPIGRLSQPYDCFIPPSYPVPISDGGQGGCPIGTREVVVQQPPLPGGNSYFYPMAVLSEEENVNDDVLRSRYEMMLAS